VGNSGDGGGTASLGVDQREGGGDLFLGERVGGVPIFSAGEKDNIAIQSVFGAFWVTDNTEMHKNSSNRLFWDHFKLIIGTLCDFSPFMYFFADFG
jgi:hypothetical protein